MELTIDKQTLRVFYGSDFHADFWKYGIKPFTDRVNIPEFDLFIFAGDVGEWRDNNCREIYKTILSAGKAIVMIPGNHEFYGSELQAVREDIEDFAEDNPGFFYLENNFLDLTVQNIRIWGSTFWTDFRGDPEARAIARLRMNDYRQIFFRRHTGGVYLEPEDTVVMHDKARTALRMAYRDLPEGWKLLTVTHHAPFPMSTPKQYRKPEYTDTAKMNKAYSSDLWGWCYNENVYPDVWIHGHIHDRAFYQVDFDGPLTTVISNPFGYPGEKNHDEISQHHLELSKNKILPV